MITDLQSVRLGTESLLEALAHDDEHLDLKSCVVEIMDARLSEMGPDKSVTDDRAPNYSETNGVARFDVVPDARKSDSQ